MTAIITLLWPTAYGQLIVIAAVGLFGRYFLAKSEIPETPHMGISISRSTAVVAWILFFGLLIGLPLFVQWCLQIG
ncbi:hypothetical protein [Brevibacillus brevis]|uniref:hypothetical protein n=1 Tax=Brevibacillus brevis TaxID=1393 RepID=UPI000A8570ED|nr:hypothetical protein [Brevibacillus brevis]